MIDLQALTASAATMPPLPETANRLSRILADERWTLEEVSKVVRLDPPLAGRALGRANAASSGFRTETKDVTQAVMRLGPGAVLGMAVGAGASNKLASEVPWLHLEQGRLWRHSVAAALAIELLPSILRRPVPPEAFAAALLHDIGKIVLVDFIGPEEVEWLERAQHEGHQSFVDAQRELFDVHYGEIGGLVAMSWGLPESIVAGISCHPSPETAATEQGREVARVVAIADAAARAICPDGSDEERNPKGVEAPDGVGEAAFRTLIGKLRERLDDAMLAYS